jgi:hypothetical protein
MKSGKQKINDASPMMMSADECEALAHQMPKRTRDIAGEVFDARELVESLERTTTDAQDKRAHFIELSLARERLHIAQSQLDVRTGRTNPYYSAGLGVLGAVAGRQAR